MKSWTFNDNLALLGHWEIRSARVLDLLHNKSFCEEMRCFWNAAFSFSVIFQNQKFSAAETFSLLWYFLRDQPQMKQKKEDKANFEHTFSHLLLLSYSKWHRFMLWHCTAQCNRLCCWTVCVCGDECASAHLARCNTVISRVSSHEH